MVNREKSHDQNSFISITVPYFEMADYDEAGRLIISRAKQLDKIPETCYGCNSDDLQMIMTHVDGGSWICLNCNYLNSYEPSMRLTKDMPFSMLNLGRDEIIFIPEWDFDWLNKN